VGFGIPLSEFNTIGFGASFEDTNIGVDPFFLSFDVAKFIANEGNKFKTIRLNTSFSYDTRNSGLFPTKGTLQQIRLEAAAPPGDLEYWKVNYDSRVFIPLYKEYVLLLKGQVGYGDSYGSTFELPFFENFYGGGPRSIRGYEESSLGPKDQFGQSYGGNVLISGNAELIIPIPGLKELKSVRLTAFFDAGNIYSTKSAYLIFNDQGRPIGISPADDIDLSMLRMSTGLSGVWLSPFGMLSVSIAQPFNEQTGDRIQKFQFTFGTNF
jgi:outer membrane protein insertion porin family